MLLSTKTTKLHELVGQVQFVVFENLQVLITQNFKGNCYLLLIMHKKKHHRKTRQTKFESMRMLFIICTHLSYTRMHSLISQSEVHNFLNLNFII